MVDGNSYYASQSVSGCESEDRLEVTASLTEAITPTGDAEQTFEEGATVGDLVVNPSDVSWFATEADALAGRNPLPIETPLISGETYFAVNIVDVCLSDPFAVTVTITLGLNDFDTLNFSYYPNPTSGIITLKYAKVISEIRVVNLLGQQVYTQNVNSVEVKVDLSALPDAVYLVQVVSEGTIKTIKVLKTN
ncbi:MAG: T9SS type A sorting domain-containing protein [Flavobacteriales bacterium]|nr:T9SS type A sorting domain-containing protein [Flavobacteriales bacterium]